MSELSNTTLRRLDLTVLLVFLGLIRHRKAVVVAAELGLTQSAISQAVKRLRDIFGDELFLRLPHGMEPTAKALALEAPVAAAIDALRAALSDAQPFAPMTATGVVRLAALDSEQSVLIPPLAARLRDLAPGITLSVLPIGRAAAMEALSQARADLALGFVWDVPDMISGETLYRESYLVAGLPEVLSRAPDIDVEDYCAADHILIAPGGDLRGVVDEALETMGKRRRVILGLPAFLPGLAAAAASGALITLPARVARSFAPGFGLVTAAPPIPLRSFPVSVFWHRRNDTDPRTQWIKRQIVDICSSQAPVPQ